MGLLRQSCVPASNSDSLEIRGSLLGCAVLSLKRAKVQDCCSGAVLHVSLCDVSRALKAKDYLVSELIDH